MFSKLKDNNLDLSLYVDILEEADAELNHVNRHKYIFGILECIMHPNVSVIQLAVLNDLLCKWFGFGENDTLDNSYQK